MVKNVLITSIFCTRYVEACFSGCTERIPMIIFFQRPASLLVDFYQRERTFIAIFRHFLRYRLPSINNELTNCGILFGTALRRLNLDFFSIVWVLQLQ
jgi:hypothetical protein